MILGKIKAQGHIPWAFVQVIGKTKEKKEVLLEQSSLQYHICCTVCVATAGGSESYKIHHWAQTSKVPSKLAKERWARTMSCVKPRTFLTREKSCSDAEDTAEKSFTTQACKLLNFNFKIRLHLFISLP